MVAMLFMALVMFGGPIDIVKETLRPCKNPWKPPILLPFLEHVTPMFLSQIIMTLAHEIIWYCCKGFLIFAGSLGDSKTSHAQQRNEEEISFQQP